MATVDQSDLQFVVTGDNEIYIDLNIHMYVINQTGWDGL